MISRRIQALVDHVKKFARTNYEKDGWDFVVECWTDEEIAEEIKMCRTNVGALCKMKEITSLQDERRREVQSTIW